MSEQLTAREAFKQATYHQDATKIRQNLSKIKNDPYSSAKRWIWELMQNAKDLKNRYGKVSIEVDLVSEDTLQFKHNGNPFQINNITGLIKQVSSKDSQNEDEDVSGKFGTGFICTHLLADVIDVSGVLYYFDRHRRFTLELDRSGRSAEELIPRIQKAQEIFEEPEVHFPEILNYEENRKEDDYDTVFTYHLSTSEKLKAAQAGLDDLVNTLPITLVTQAKKIKFVHVVDHVRNTDVTYKCDYVDLDENVVYSSIQINDEKKEYLSYITKDVALTIEVKKNEYGYALIPRDTKQPVLYRDFPLIGSEKFYFPFTFNGFRFWPSEKRNSIPLNSNDNEEAKDNRVIVELGVAAALKFNEWLISHNATNRYLLAFSRKPEPEVAYDEDVALPWIKELQINWRKQLVEQYLAETETAVVPLKELSVPLYGSTKAVRTEFYELLNGFYFGRGYLPIPEHLHGWIEVLSPEKEYSSWNLALKYELEDFLTDLANIKSVDGLCSKLGKTRDSVIEWLNKVYKFLVDQNCMKDFNEYAIIPNQLGDFCLLDSINTDQTARIPAVLKDIYNSVNIPEASIQHILLEATIDASVFGNSIKVFGLKEITETLNNYIKSGSFIILNNETIDVKDKVAYSLLALYPNSDEAQFISKRKQIYDFCTAYRSMPVYTSIEVNTKDLWTEADNYWFNCSYIKIQNCVTVANVAFSFFVAAKTQEETLNWLNDYIAFYRANSFGDFLKDKKVFPNQQLNLAALTELHYDSNIPEEFKDLAKYAGNPTSPADVYRHLLLHRAILGYETHDPYKLEDIHKYIKKQFETYNDYAKEVIARHAITILLKTESGEPEEKKLYDFACTISGHTFDLPKYVDTVTGFSRVFVQEFYIKLLCNRIAQSVNLTGFRNLSTTFADKTDEELIEWIDSFIEFVHSYKTSTYWTIISNKDEGIGVWLNQNNEFCRFQEVRFDEVHSEPLKDLAAKNIHINHDYRKILFSQHSSKSKYLETLPVTLEEVAEFIDDKLAHYEGRTQETNFRALIFELGKICQADSLVESYMEFYKKEKNALIVGSLSEGRTLDLVGAIVQQGDEKLELIQQIVDCPVDKLQEVVKKIAKFESNSRNADSNDEDLTDYEIIEVRKVEKFEVTTPKGTFTVDTGLEQYAGLSVDQVKAYVQDAKDAVAKYFKELNDGYNINYDLVKDNTYSQLYGISDKYGNPVPIVVHSYKGPQYRFFELNWYDWQVLKEPNSQLWVLTGTGLRCIPLYSLPVRKFNFDLENASPNVKAILRVLATAGYQSTKTIDTNQRITFEFGNNMPYGFKDQINFNDVPQIIEDCTKSIGRICEDNANALAAQYYLEESRIPIFHTNGYSRALQAINEEESSAREIYDLKEKPADNFGVGAGLEDTL